MSEYSESKSCPTSVGESLRCESCGSDKCFNHHGLRDIKCVNCIPHDCVRLLDNTHGNSSARQLLHSHCCVICGSIFEHTHDLYLADDEDHPLVCPACASQALVHTPMHKRIHRRDFLRIGFSILVLVTMVALIASLIPVFSLGLLAPIRSALVTANNITAESGEVIRTAAHLVGTRLQEAIRSLGEDEEQVQDTVLHVTKVASILAMKHLNRTSAPVMEVANGVSVLAGDLLEFASLEIRQACWLVACMFLSKEACSEQFYTEFHLCDKPLINITEAGTSYLVSPPCQFHGNYITTKTTQKYDEYVKTRLLNKIMLAVSKMKELDEFNSIAFRRLAESNRLYEHLANIAEEECSIQKPFLQKDCFISHCMDPVNSQNMVSKEAVAYNCLFMRLKRGQPLIPDTKE